MITAAKELSISQPALSSQLKQLEGEIGAPIFDRSTRNLDLTDKGQHLFYFTKQIFETCELMFNQITPNESLPISLRIGISEQIERTLCIPFISTIFHSQNPVDAKRFSVESCDNKTNINRLEIGEFDLTITNESSENTSIVTLASIDTPVVLAVPRQYRSSKTPFKIDMFKTALAPNELGLVLPKPRIFLRNKINTFLLEQKIEPRIIFESDIFAIMIRAVVDGIGAGFFPTSYIEKEIKEQKIKVAGLPNGFWKEQILLLANKNSSINNYFEELKSIFIDSFS